MSLKLTVVEHQNAHHNKQPGKSQWLQGRDTIDRLLITFVTSKEQELRQAIQDEKLYRVDGPLRRVFYIVDYFGPLFPNGYCQNKFDGVCVEVVIVKYGENLEAEIHGFPVDVKEAGISLSMSELCQ